MADNREQRAIAERPQCRGGPWDGDHIATWAGGVRRVNGHDVIQLWNRDDSLKGTYILWLVMGGEDEWRWVPNA